MGFPWGLDFGNQNCVLAVARKGGIDVIDNEASSRRTPCMVGLGGKERALGEAAKSKIASNIQNTVTDLKRLIGRKWAEQDLQDDLANFPFTVVEGPNGGILVELMYEKDGGDCETRQFTTEQLLAMLFIKLKSTAEAHNKSPSPDCVISLPCFFTDAQVCVVAFTKSKMTVLATAFDRNLGGRDFDMAMLKHFAAEWKTKTGLDIMSSQKAKLRLLVAIDKVKQQLSGYSTFTKLPVNVECLQNDRDFSSIIDTDTWSALTASLIQRALDPVKAVMRDAKLSFDSIEEIEVVGSATRSPLVVNALREFFGKEPKRTMNSEEAVSKGCALQAAMISPNFRVREFSIADSTPYAIALSWSATAQGGDHMETESDGVKEKSEKGNVVFSKHNILPSAKMLTFMRSQTFDVTASYADPSELAPGTNPFIGVFTISNIPKLPDGAASKIKVKVRLDLHGLLSMDSAQALEEVEVDEEEAKKEEPKKDQSMADAAPIPPADAPPPPEPAAPTEAAAPASDAPAAKKKKVRKHDLTMSSSGLSQMANHMLDQFRSVEYEMATQDRHIMELQERKNDLESYMYLMRDRVSGDLAEYIVESDKNTLLQLITTLEDWLYSEEAEHANKSAFISRLDELRKYGGSAEERFREAQDRPVRVRELEEAVSEYAAFAASADAAYDHISAEDRDKVAKEVKAVQEWASTKLAEQAARRSTDPLAVTCEEIRRKREDLAYVCRPIKNKPKPAPPKPESKPEEKAAAPQGAPEEKAEAPAEPATAANAMDEGLD